MIESAASVRPEPPGRPPDLLHPPACFHPIDRRVAWTAAAVALGALWAALATGATPLPVLTLCVLAAVTLTALIAWNRYNYGPWSRLATPAGEGDS
ncbi:hypothetical protein [Nonomuraea sp. KM88]|uniref:hypothetical protein n=1 Tax=Nonomuraea sp. KM88 TaxID=3457427 RepID=UPI003FCD2D23